MRTSPPIDFTVCMPEISGSSSRVTGAPVATTLNLAGLSSGPGPHERVSEPSVSSSKSATG